MSKKPIRKIGCFLTGSVLVYLCCAILLSACQSAVSPAQTTAVPTATPIHITLMGRPLKGDRPAVYRLMEDGKLRYIQDQMTYNALAYQPNDLLAITNDQLHSYPLALPLTRWITSKSDSSLYFLQNGNRYRVMDSATLGLTGGSIFDVAQVSDAYLASFPLSDQPIAGLKSMPKIPAVTAAQWAQGALWVAKNDGSFIRWTGNGSSADAVSRAGNPTVSTLAVANNQLYAAADDGTFSRFDTGTTSTSVLPKAERRISAVAGEWYADTNYYDFGTGTYHIGRGLIRLSGGILNLNSDETDPLKNITALALDTPHQALWVGTRSLGLLRYDLAKKTWVSYNTFKSTLADNHINAISLDSSGGVWLALPGGLGYFDGTTNGKFEIYPVPDDVTDKGVFALAAADNDTIGVGGENYVGVFNTKTQKWTLFSAFDNPLLIDRFRAVTVDDQQTLWFVGDEHLIHWANGSWTSYDSSGSGATIGAATALIQDAPLSAELTFPAAQTNYTDWLKTWPRPKDDNGRGMHYLAYPSNDPLQLQQQIDRLKALGVHWLLVNYTGRAQLPNMAKAFTDAGIMVIWRPFVRPYREYAYWAKDVYFLRAYGIPPYMQIYNEPSLGQEWEDDHRQVDQSLYMSHMLPAMQQVYDAGGYVGVQEIDLDWLRTLLQAMKTGGKTDIFQKMFFIPHAYGYNHPPEFDSDMNGVLGFRDFAEVFRQEIGWIPMMVAGEGGWRPGEAQDNRYPMVTQTLHRDYLIAVLNWFHTGKLSNAAPLPDYLFGFCPWILSDPNDPAAWFDSSGGDKLMLIQAVENLPSFQRKFSWDSP